MKIAITLILISFIIERLALKIPLVEKENGDFGKVVYLFMFLVLTMKVMRVVSAFIILYWVAFIW